MKERSILFSAPMVRALLAGTKTVTRRLVKPQPTTERLPRDEWGSSELGLAPLPARYFPFRAVDDEHSNYAITCPVADKGDVLWVREAWRTSKCVDDKPGSVLETPGNGYGWPVWCEADGVEHRWGGKAQGGPGFTAPGRYRHARFMPRWASRLMLRVSDVRIERLHEITEADAKAEGVERGTCTHPDCSPGSCASSRYRPEFAMLWDAINGKRASWASNPWCWAISFEVMSERDVRLHRARRAA